MDRTKAVVVDDLEALRVGFAPGSVGIPTKAEGAFVLMGLSADRTRVMASPETYRMVGKKLVKAGVKTYSEVGMINGLDLGLASHGRLREVTGNSSAIREALAELRRLIADHVGNDIVGRDDLPPEFRVINAALSHKASDRKDHARLVIRWSWLFSVFSEHPDCLDRAVAGESLWDVLPEDYDPETVREMKRMKKFDATWIGGGLQTRLFIKKLVASCGYIPNGGQRPTNAAEARALINIVDFYDTVFGDFPEQVKEMMKFAVIAKGDSWRGGHEFEYSYVRDYVSYMYHNIIVDSFRLLEATAQAEGLFAAAVALFGTDPKRIVDASSEWHQIQREDRRFQSMVRGWTQPVEATSWCSAIDTIRAPNGLYIVPLDTADELAQEGNGQRHCVYSQRRDCAEGRQRVASIRIIENGVHRALSTFSFKPDAKGIQIREHRGFANSTPDDKATEAVWWFEEQCNEGTNPFRLNLDWPASLPGPQPDLKDVILKRFEECKSTLPKRLQKAGLELILSECAR
jgi:hypothetical protein